MESQIMGGQLEGSSILQATQATESLDGTSKLSSSQKRHYDILLGLQL